MQDIRNCNAVTILGKEVWGPAHTYKIFDCMISSWRGSTRVILESGVLKDAYIRKKQNKTKQQQKK